MLRCLAKERKDRFQTARELGAALAALLDAVPWTSDHVRRFWLMERGRTRSPDADITVPSPFASTAPG